MGDRDRDLDLEQPRVGPGGDLDDNPGDSAEVGPGGDLDTADDDDNGE